MACNPDPVALLLGRHNMSAMPDPGGVADTGVEKLYDSEQQLYSVSYNPDPYEQVVPLIFAGLAIVQFVLAAIIFICLVYFIIRDYIELQRQRALRHGDVWGAEDDGLIDPNLAPVEDDDDILPAAGPDGGGTGARHRQPAAPVLPPLAAPTTVDPPAGQASAVPRFGRTTDTSSQTASTASTGSDQTSTSGRVDDNGSAAANSASRTAGGSKLKKMRYNRKQQTSQTPIRLADSSELEYIFKMAAIDAQAGNEDLDASIAAMTSQQRNSVFDNDVTGSAIVASRDWSVNDDVTQSTPIPVNPNARAAHPVRPVPVITSSVQRPPASPATTATPAAPAAISRMASTGSSLPAPASLAAAQLTGRPSSIPTFIVAARSPHHSLPHHPIDDTATAVCRVRPGASLSNQCPDVITVSAAAQLTTNIAGSLPAAAGPDRDDVSKRPLSQTTPSSGSTSAILDDTYLLNDNDVTTTSSDVRRNYDDVIGQVRNRQTASHPVDLGVQSTSSDTDVDDRRRVPDVTAASDVDRPTSNMTSSRD